MTQQEMDPRELEGIVSRIQKLFKLAERGGTEAEAASAAAKAQELLAAYNLDMATVERAGSDSGRRETAKVGGGMYVYERELWRAVAELNFCLHFVTRRRAVRTPERRAPDGTLIRRERTYWQHCHNVVGRTVNVQATEHMARYLQQTAERLCREAIHGDQSQFFSSWAVAYREGVVERVIEKLQKRRADMISEERLKEERLRAEATRAARDGVSTSRAVSLTSVTQSERDANFDHLYGEGWSAQRRAEQARRAEARRQAEEAYTRWAEANPEEARKEAEKARKEAERRSRRGYRWTARDSRRNSGGFYEGYDAGAGVSIDPQVGSGAQRRIGR